MYTAASCKNEYLPTTFTLVSNTYITNSSESIYFVMWLIANILLFFAQIIYFNGKLCRIYSMLIWVSVIYIGSYSYALLAQLLNTENAQYSFFRQNYFEVFNNLALLFFNHALMLISQYMYLKLEVKKLRVTVAFKYLNPILTVIATISVFVGGFMQYCAEVEEIVTITLLIQSLATFILLKITFFQMWAQQITLESYNFKKKSIIIIAFILFSKIVRLIHDSLNRFNPEFVFQFKTSQDYHESFSLQDYGWHNPKQLQDLNNIWPLMKILYLFFAAFLPRALISYILRNKN